jgi:hypothetical protein
LTAGLGLLSGALAAATLGKVISVFVSGLTILIALDFLGLINVEEDSSLGAGEGVAGG